VDGKVNEESVITWTLDVAHAANGSKASIGTAGEHKHALSIFDAAGEQVALLKPESELSRIYAVSWSPDSARVAYQVNTSVSIDASSTPVSFTHKIILFDVTTGTAQTVASGVSPSFLDDGSLVYLDDMGRVVRRDAMENASTTVLVDRGTEDVGANDTLVVTPHAEQLIVSRPSAFDVVTYAKAKDATTYAKLAEYKDKEMFAPTLSPNGKEVYFLTTVGSSPNRTVSVGALDIASGSFRTVFPLAFPPQSYAFLTWGK
jgi:hypothetical protein